MRPDDQIIDDSGQRVRRVELRRSAADASVALAFDIKMPEKQPRCAWFGCDKTKGSTGKMLACKNCASPFCGPEHYKLAWTSFHKSACPLVAKLAP